MIRKKDSALETVLRYEIVVALFALIGLYYFLSFSPFRMPEEPICSRPLPLAPLPAVAGKAVPQKAAPEKAAPGKSAEENPAALLPGRSAAESSPVPAAERVAVTPPKPLSAAVPAADNGTAPAAPSANAGPAPTAPVPAPPAVAAPVASPPAAPAPPPAASAPAPAAAASPPVPAPAAAPAASREAAAGKPRPVSIIAADCVLPLAVTRAKARLDKLGLAYRVETRVEPTPMYRVYLGPFKSRAAARRMEALSRKMGDEPFLRRRSGGWLVIVSSFYLQSNVVAWENMYAAAGLEPKVMRERLPLKHTLLLVEAGGSRGVDPQTLLARLRAAGFAAARLVASTPSGSR